MYSALFHLHYHDWGALEQSTEPSTAPRVPQHKWLPTAPGVCSWCVCVFTAVCVHFGEDKCRAQILSVGYHTLPHVTSLSLSLSYSPQDKIIVEFIKKNYAVQKFTYTWFLILCGSLNVFLFSDSWSWVPCLSWTVKLFFTVLQKIPSGFTNSLAFQHLLCIWTLSNNDCMILRFIFSHWGTHMKLLPKVQTLADAPEGKTMHTLFEFEDQGKINLFCLLENMYLLKLLKWITKLKKHI